MSVRLSRVIALGLIGLLAACASQPRLAKTPVTVDGIAARYVHLALTLNRLDPGSLIDNQAPAALRAQAASADLKLLDVSRQAQQAIIDLNKLPLDDQPQRRKVLVNQLASLTGRASLLRGWKPGFDDEIRAIYDAEPLADDEKNLAAVRRQLDQALPAAAGASLAQRYVDYLQRYAVTGAVLEASFRTAVSAARGLCAKQLDLPPQEQLQFSASADAQPDRELREQYLGNGQSRLQLNTASSMTLARVIELAARETYPGRHLGDSLRQQQLYHDRGWVEYSLLPRYSPLAFVAEGRARAAAGVVFPTTARIALEQQLFRQAGFDPRQAAAYDRVWALGQRLQPAIYQAARALLNGGRDAAQTHTWLQGHALLTAAQASVWIARIEHQRSAAVVGILAQQVVSQWLQAPAPAGSVREDPWPRYRRLLETPVTPYQLQRHSGAAGSSG